MNGIPGRGRHAELLCAAGSLYVRCCCLASDVATPRYRVADTRVCSRDTRADIGGRYLSDRVGSWELVSADVSLHRPTLSADTVTRQCS